MKKEKVLVAMSPKKSLRDSTGQAGESRKKRVLVAMSGGIDSSVAAALLKKQGYDVVGVFLRLWKPQIEQIRAEFSGDGEKSARKVARKLGIRFIVIDVRKEFKKKVVDYFLREYQAERTPNPCVVCNENIKFKFLFEKLTEFGADYVATGHYARLRREFPISNFQFPNKFKIQNSKFKILYKLFTAKDKSKDQSYFLYTLTQKQLAKILFPLGDYTKDEVKKKAKKFRLPVLDREESRGVCFIAGKHTDDFLRKYLRLKQGNIADINGNVIGKHSGLPLYTIGQRRNIRIGGTGPYYVLAKNLKRNLLEVANNANDPRLFQKSLLVGKVNWISRRPKLPLEAKVRIRYLHPTVCAIIKSACNMQHVACNKVYRVEFEKPQRAVTAGQSAVFYTKKGEVLGGGMIK